MAREDFRFKTDIRVRFGETDLQGVVYNAHYLVFLDTAQVEYLRHLGIDYPEMRERGHDIVIADVRVQFRSPAYFDDLLEAYVRIPNIGHSSVEMEYEIYDQKSGRLVASAQTSYVIVETSTGRPVRAPGYLRVAVRQFEENTEIEES